MIDSERLAKLAYSALVDSTVALQSELVEVNALVATFGTRALPKGVATSVFSMSRAPERITDRIARIKLRLDENYEAIDMLEAIFTKGHDEALAEASAAIFRRRK